MKRAVRYSRAFGWLAAAAILAACASSRPPPARPPIEAEPTSAPARPRLPRALRQPRRAAEYAASHILISYSGGTPRHMSRSKDRARERARVVLALALEPGADFADLARRYSDSPSGARGGVIVPLAPSRTSRLLKPLLTALQKTRVGRVHREVVETRFGFHVVKRRRLDKIVVRHILISHQAARSKRSSRSKQQARSLATQLRARVVAGASIADLARKHSDCPSAARGGEIGPFARGVMVHPFERASFSLAVGQTAPVVETRHGFHVIKRVR